MTTPINRTPADVAEQVKQLWASTQAIQTALMNLRPRMAEHNPNPDPDYDFDCLRDAVAAVASAVDLINLAGRPDPTEYVVCKANGAGPYVSLLWFAGFISEGFDPSWVEVMDEAERFKKSEANDLLATLQKRFPEMILSVENLV